MFTFDIMSGELFVTLLHQIWTHPGWTPLKTLAGHEGKVMSVDVTPGECHCLILTLWFP